MVHANEDHQLHLPDAPDHRPRRDGDVRRFEASRQADRIGCPRDHGGHGDADRGRGGAGQVCGRGSIEGRQARDQAGGPAAQQPQDRRPGSGPAAGRFRRRQPSPGRGDAGLDRIRAARAEPTGDQPRHPPRARDAVAVEDGPQRGAQGTDGAPGNRIASGPESDPATVGQAGNCPGRPRVRRRRPVRQYSGSGASTS